MQHLTVQFVGQGLTGLRLAALLTYTQPKPGFARHAPVFIYIYIYTD